MHTLTVTLKQHTPLIHFQHDQEGATLRASEVKPKLDKFILTRLGNGKYEDGIEQAKSNGWLVGKGDHPALDYKMRITTNERELQLFKTNEKRRYNQNNRKKDEANGKIIRIVKNGDIIDKTEKNTRYIIKENNQEFFAKVRKEDHKVIFDLGSYPCFFANIDADITNPEEYRKLSFTDDLLTLSLSSKNENLLAAIDNNELLSSFFLNHNFGTRQSKGFGSFYIYEEDSHYIAPTSRYNFSLLVDGEYYDNDFNTVFNQIELFTKSIRAGLNVKNGKKTVFYFKSLAFMYCKNMFNSKWDKKCVKTHFYFKELKNQQNSFNDDENHDVLFFDDGNGYDIRDMLGFSTNEEWQSYQDSIEKKVAITDKNNPNIFLFPRREDTLPVDRMRSPLLIKPICIIDDNNNVSYKILLIFQDQQVGIERLKEQRKICFFSKKRKDNQNRLMRFMIDIPQDFSMENYFNFIFGEDERDMIFDISTHVEQQYQERNEYDILEDIYSQIKENIQ